MTINVRVMTEAEQAAFNLKMQQEQVEAGELPQADAHVTLYKEEKAQAAQEVRLAELELMATKFLRKHGLEGVEQDEPESEPAQ